MRILRTKRIAPFSTLRTISILSFYLFKKKFLIEFFVLKSKILIPISGLGLSIESLAPNLTFTIELIFLMKFFGKRAESRAPNFY